MPRNLLHTTIKLHFLDKVYLTTNIISQFINRLGNKKQKFVKIYLQCDFIII